MEKRYRSQIEYGEYGGLICTPVCCLVTIAHVRDELCYDMIEQAMVEGHAMFKGRREPMMIQDLTSIFNVDGLNYSEAAGLTHTGEREQIESLLLCPLKILLKELTIEKSGGLIVTCLGHTVCYLLTKGGGLYLFDPLPAKLKDVTLTWAETLPSADVEYSAILLNSCGPAC